MAVFASDPNQVNPAKVIADYLIAECRERGELLTNLKLQKLLYYADAWNLALYDEPLFTENFKAWVHGPVLTSQYHRFKDYRWQPIAEEIEKPEVSDDLAAHLDEIVDVFGCETAVALELMTHQEKPWLEARGDLPTTEPSSAPVSKETTKQFYRSFKDG